MAVASIVTVQIIRDLSRRTQAKKRMPDGGDRPASARAHLGNVLPHGPGSDGPARRCARRERQKGAPHPPREIRTRSKTNEPFVHDYWEEVFVVSGTLTDSDGIVTRPALAIWPLTELSVMIRP
jgi:hypothetical protein